MGAASNVDTVPMKLDQLGFVGRGKSRHRPRNDPSLYGGQYPFIQTADVKEAGLYLWQYSQTYNEKGLTQSKLWDPGTLCITIAANIAETAILKIRACFPDSIVGFIADKNKCDVRFIKYYIDTIKSSMQSASLGTAQDNLSLDKLMTFEFLMPPLPYQIEIANLLSAYDDLIENNNRRIAILEEMARSLYREWFVNFRFPGHQEVKMVDSPLGPIPEGWKVGNFLDISDVLSGGTPKTNVPEYWNGSIPFFSPRDAPPSFFVVDTEKKLTELGLKNCNSRLYNRNTIFITARGTVGKLALAAKEMAMNQSCYALQGKNGFNQYFTFLVVLNNISRLQKCASGSTFDAITIDDFKTLQLVIPSCEIIKKFSDIISIKFDLILNLANKNTILRRTRDLLLPRLISGEIDVSNLDNATIANAGLDQ